MDVFNGLRPWEIVVLSGLFAVTAFTVVSVFAMAVAYWATREPASGRVPVAEREMVPAGAARTEARRAEAGTDVHSPMATAG